MGYARCESCGKVDYRDEIGFSCCEVAANLGYDGDECEDCSVSHKTAKCSKCKQHFCEDHGDFDRKECCGLRFCGLGDEGCQEEEHVTRKLEECGHLTCNRYKFKGECRICKLTEEQEEEEACMLQDKVLVEELLEKAKSNGLKQELTKWMKNLPSSNKEAVHKKKQATVKVVSKTKSNTK